ncbi:MAG: sulfate reduction electron transfer complex DsrMKJOP subunit DsrJ [Clostridia bacterium]|nr:sulfate reduction electron transfer complex DsrMKJOP subunit DsrJ [Clostridia bacterium]
MYNGSKVLVGLGLFFLIVTVPFWLGFGTEELAPELDLDTPAIAQLADKKCIEPTGVMREEHMQLLEQWRDQAVRMGNRYYEASDGTVYQASLQNTCLDCHSNKSDFCDRCHDYGKVSPDCWTCHLDPEGMEL